MTLLVLQVTLEGIRGRGEH